MNIKDIQKLTKMKITYCDDNIISFDRLSYGGGSHSRHPYIYDYKKDKVIFGDGSYPYDPRKISRYGVWTTPIAYAWMKSIFPFIRKVRELYKDELYEIHHKGISGMPIDPSYRYDNEHGGK